jgi:TolB-like protein
MTSSRTSSGSLRVAGAVVLCVALAACAGRQRLADEPASDPPVARLVLYPVHNLAGMSVPAAEIGADIEAALRDRGVEVVSGARLERVLSRHRIRSVAGVDGEAVKVLGEEFDVTGILLPVVHLHRASSPPQFGIALRLVSVSDPPVILWMDSVASSGDESPGLLGRGLVTDYAVLRRKVIGRIADSLAGQLGGRSARAREPSGRRFRPGVAYRSPSLEMGGRTSVAVLPFGNDSGREGAGEVLTLEFVRQLHRSARFEVIEPGVVRRQLLAHRVGAEGGVSVDAARLLVETLDAGLVLVGRVYEYVETTDAATAPRVNFSVQIVEREHGEMVWMSTSFGRGDDGVWFFDAGRVGNASALSARMVAGVVRGALRGKPSADETAFDVRRLGTRQATRSSPSVPRGRVAGAPDLDATTAPPPIRAKKQRVEPDPTATSERPGEGSEIATAAPAGPVAAPTETIEGVP